MIIENKFHKKVDDIATEFNVDAVLIMKSNKNTMEVMASGGEKGKTIYHKGDKGNKSTSPQGNHPLYCEKVVNTNQVLEVQDAANNSEWKNNEDLTEFGFGAYLGIPLEKEGVVVGTVCALHHKATNFGIGNKTESIYASLKSIKAELEKQL